MTTPDPTSFGLGKGISNPANDPAADRLGATHPSYSHPYTEPNPRAVPGVTVGFSAQATRSTVVKLPFMELPLVAFTLAVITGALNAFTLMQTGTFATVQAGNILFGVIALMTGQWQQALTYLLVMVAFGLGVFLSAALFSSKARRSVWMSWLLVALGVGTAFFGILVIVGLTNYIGWIILGISFLAGVMSNAYRTDSNMLFGALAVTFLFQMTFNFLARATFRREGLDGVANVKWAGTFFSVLLGFILGAFGGVGFLVLFGAKGVGAAGGLAGGWLLVIVAILFLMLAGFSKQTRHEGESIE